MTNPTNADDVQRLIDETGGPVTMNGVTYGWEPDEMDTINANEADDYRYENDDAFYEGDEFYE